MPTFILLSVGIHLIIPKIKRSETHNFGNYHICERIIYRFSVARAVTMPVERRILS